MKNEFVLAFNEVLEEKQLPRDVILDALQAAMVSAYRRAVNASNAQQVEATVDLETGKVAIFAEKEVVEVVQDSRTEVSLEDALRVDPNAALGGMVVVESTPDNFGRVAAQTARQVIQQRIREAERDAQLNYYGKQLGEIMSGIVQAVNSQAITLGLDMKAEGAMPRNQQIPGERFRVHDRVRTLLMEVKPTSRGPQIILSRAHRNFLRRLLENEVPEIYQGLVEIRSIAREPGQRSKVAVSALQPGVDPVGACVGLRGVRIQAIVRELNDEKIDVIEWNSDPTVYIAKALSPARVNGVYLNEHTKGAKTATVVVPEDQLSLAIGRDGQNARLAAKLTSWRIDIKSLPEAATDAVHKLQSDPDYALLAQQEADGLPQIETVLAKKSEGRPVTPEEYTLLNQFVDRIERGLIRQREKDQRAEEERQRIAAADIPATAYEIPLEEMGISLRFATILAGAGYPTAGDLMLQMQLDPNSVLGIEGIGAKAIEEIEAALAKFSIPAPEAEVQPEAPVEVEVPVGEAPAIEEELEVAPAIEAQAVVEALPELVAASEVEAAAPVAVEMAQPEVVEAEEQEVEVTTEPESVAQVAPVPEEEPSSFDELFKLRADVMELVSDEEEEEDESGHPTQKKKKKKKKKFVELEYDPDKDVVVARKKRKRGVGEWDEGW
jgi:N utilization substance protein A